MPNESVERKGPIKNLTKIQMQLWWGYGNECENWKLFDQWTVTIKIQHIFISVENPEYFIDMDPSQLAAGLGYLHPSQYRLPANHIKITAKLKTLPAICYILELRSPLGEL